MMKRGISYSNWKTSWSGWRFCVLRKLSSWKITKYLGIACSIPRLIRELLKCRQFLCTRLTQAVQKFCLLSVTRHISRHISIMNAADKNKRLIKWFICHFHLFTIQISSPCKDFGQKGRKGIFFTQIPTKHIYSLYY